MEAQTVESLGSDYEPLRDTALALPDQARLIVITDDEELAFANEWTKQAVLARMDAIREFFKDRKARARAVWQDLVDLEKAALEPCEAARKIIDRAVLTYDTRREAERQAAVEKARLAQAEAERQAIIKRASYVTGCAISYAAECIEADERKRAVAAAAETAGDSEVAEAMKQEIGKYEPPTLQPELSLPPVVAVPVAAEPAKAVGGASVKKNWKARLDDKMALVRFIAEHPEHENLLDLNEAAATKLAKAYEGRLSQIIPGLSAFNDPNVSRRR